MRRIEFGEIRINDKMRNYLNECLDANWITLGPKTELLEDKLAEKMHYKHIVAVNSGTSADIAACAILYDLGAKPGDEIICPALGFIAYANAIRAAGFTPVFVDIKKETLNINEELIEQAITNKTRAVLCVNTMGKPCKMDVISAICTKHNLLFICDNCEGHLCQYQGKYMSEYADLCTYSAYIAHLVISCEQGYVGTNKTELANLIKSIRSHGRPVDSNYFQHERFGLNLKPTDLHSCIGLGNVDELYHVFAVRKTNLYRMSNHPYLRKFFYLSEEDGGDVNCPHGFSLTVKDPKHYNCMVETLNKYNIHHKRNFGCIPTQHGAFAYMNVPQGTFPESEYVGNYGVHIGCHQYLQEEDMVQIESCFNEMCNKMENL